MRWQAGFLPRYLLARRTGQLVGGALVLQRRLPVFGVVGYVPHGPVIAARTGHAAVAQVVSAALADLARRQLSGLFI
ncbi:MAG: GNAT family N-acetyltransferase, partial [Actinomycetota bacterium]|nr:GNAT family N-acetyltransferase [Actinomycetota bacterium]